MRALLFTLFILATGVLVSAQPSGPTPEDRQINTGSLSARALEPGRLADRQITVEWDPLDGAFGYQIEFTAHGNFKRSSKVKEPLWTGPLLPGKYKMRLRGLDRRGVPGDWSEAEEFEVGLEKVQWITSSWTINAKNRDEEDISLAWKPVPGAREYIVTVQNVTGGTSSEGGIKIHRTETPSATLDLPVAQLYRLTVSAEGLGRGDRDAVKSESPAEAQLELQGPALKSAQIEKPSSKFVRELQWTADSLAQTSEVRLLRWNSETQKFAPHHSQGSLASNRLQVPAEWPGGRYRFQVRNHALLRKSSPWQQIEFEMMEGDRSEEAETTALIRESIERTKGWFAIASYLVTALTYTGVNSDNLAGNSLQVTFPQNFGGTGRLGLGYLSSETPWGFLGIADLGGFIVRGKNPTFASAEFNVIYRTELGSRGELRQQYGVFYKEVPELIALNTDEIRSIDKIASLGPHAGLEYWVAISPKLGFQMNGHVYPNLVSVKTPNGNPITLSFSYQLGLLGSYRLSRTTTGLMGYAYRKDSQAYKSKANKTNSIDLTGHYLNFFLEWPL